MIVRGIPIAYILASTLLGCATIVDSLRVGNMRPQFLLYLPNYYDAADLTTDELIYVVNAVYQFWAMAVIFPPDTIIQLTFFNIPMLATIIVDQIEEFQDKLMDCVDTKSRLVHIIRMQEEYLE